MTAYVHENGLLARITGVTAEDGGRRRGSHGPSTPLSPIGWP